MSNTKQTTYAYRVEASIKNALTHKPIVDFKATLLNTDGSETSTIITHSVQFGLQMKITPDNLMSVITGIIGKGHDRTKYPVLDTDLFLLNTRKYSAKQILPPTKI